MYKIETLLLIAVAGLAAQLVDGGLGMGFGATSSTMLIALAGLTPAAASAVVHTAELGTTLASGVAHTRFGNVDWRTAFAIGIPGAIGAFLGATVLVRLSTEAARPVMSLILALIGLNLMLRFARGLTQRKLAEKPHSRGFLAGLGLFGGIVGTVTTAEFLVTLAATLGFAVGMWHDLMANLAGVVALLLGGVVAAPIGAWVVTRMNPIALGGVVGTLIVFLNLPVVLKFAGMDSGLWVVRVLILLLGAALSVRGVLKARENSKAAGEREGATVVDPEPAHLR